MTQQRPLQEFIESGIKGGQAFADAIVHHASKGIAFGESVGLAECESFQIWLDGASQQLDVQTSAIATDMRAAGHGAASVCAYRDSARTSFNSRIRELMLSTVAGHA